jgi:AbrB family looped-hinge helix DNA binding protein
MNVKIDKSGRIVLPKPVRERLRLRAGTNLELEEGPEGLLLRPVGQRPAMVQKNGMLVHLGKAPRGLDWDRLIEDSREDRIKDVAGL